MSARNTVRARLLRACYSFMLPVARFLLRNGVSYREFEHVSRLAFVEVASTEYGLRGRPTNISRVAAMTGIGRKEVSRLRRRSAEYAESPRVDLSPLSDVLHRWHTDPAFLDAKGQPKPLSYQGRRSSFAALVKVCGGDLPPGAVRFELVRCGAVIEKPKRFLQAVRRTVIQSGQDERLISSMVFNLRSLASTIAFNSVDPPRGDLGRIERFCESDPLSEHAIATNRPMLRERIQRFITGIDDMFADTKPKALEAGRRVGVGVFYYEDD